MNAYSRIQNLKLRKWSTVMLAASIPACLAWKMHIISCCGEKNVKRMISFVVAWHRISWTDMIIFVKWSDLIWFWWYTWIRAHTNSPSVVSKLCWHGKLCIGRAIVIQPCAGWPWPRIGPVVSQSWRNPGMEINWNACYIYSCAVSLQMPRFSSYGEKNHVLKLLIGTGYYELTSWWVNGLILTSHLVHAHTSLLP